ncbi:hypothetical protein ACOME3_003173 [Neoechinorhynchus agilis]
MFSFRTVLSLNKRIHTIAQVQSHLQKLVLPQSLDGPDKVYMRKRIEDAEKITVLEPKRMNDSFSRIIIPLSTNPSAHDEYRSFVGKVRTARILEDLDTMAVHVAYRHNRRDYFVDGCLSSPITIVTAAVDAIEVHKYMDIDRDLRLSGRVGYVGSSSCCINMQLEQKCGLDDWEDILKAMFIMVARSPVRNCKVAMNPLLCNDDDEKREFEESKHKLEKRRKRTKISLEYSPPDANESKLIHDIHLQTTSGSIDGQSVYMTDTILKNAFVCEPQQRNIYNKIFGGYLMKSSYELAWANTRIFAKTFPKIIMIGDVSFKIPVEIGSLLFFTSIIAYTSEQRHMIARVNAEVVDPSTGSHQYTNCFYFLFKADEDIPRVVPRTYSEYMIYLDGKRHYKEMISRKR